MTMKTRIATMLAGAALISAGAQAATVTPVSEPNNPAQKNHAEIFADLFGGVFAADGNNYTNGTVYVTRMDDDMDQTFDFLEWEAHALATWANASQAFGTVADGKLFDVTGDDNAVGGQVLGQPGATGIEFARFGNEVGSDDVSSVPSSNADGKDHMVTYTWTVNGVPAANRYLLFFEDSDETTGYFDKDFNDLVVEVIGTPVPEPTSLALVGLGGLAMLRRRR